MRSGLAVLTCGALLANTFIFLASDRAYAHAGTSPAAVAEAEALDPEIVTEPQRCPGDLRLVASVVNEARPQLSLAVVRNAGGARVLPIGGRLDDLVLVELQPSYAELRTSAGTFCVLPAFDPLARAHDRERKPVPAAKPREPEDQAPAKTDAKPRAHLTQEDLQQGISPVGKGEYSISRELLLKALKNPGGAAAGAHFRAAERDGRSLGMEVRGVREGSTLSRMGMKTGDIVQTINGLDVSNPLGLLDTLKTAREADSFTITIMRDGRVQALRYSVR
jgi:hypothetical protein